MLNIKDLIWEELLLKPREADSRKAELDVKLKSASVGIVAANVAATCSSCSGVVEQSGIITTKAASDYDEVGKP